LLRWILGNKSSEPHGSVLDQPLGRSELRRNFVTSWAVTIIAFAVIIAGPIYQLTAFAIDSGHFTWMQTAYDEPFYISYALTSSLSFGQLTLSQLPAHLMRALGISDIGTVAIVSKFILSPLAFGAAWVLAGTLTSAAIERACWTFALAFAFQFFSLNSPIIFSPTLAEHLERTLGAQWLFAADSFPYFQLFRTPEPQTTWIPFFLYLAVLARFASTLDLRLYRLLCLITPLFAIGYVAPAISAWLLFGMLSVYSILFLRLPLRFAFLITFSITSGLLFAAFWVSNRGAALMSIYDSHLPLLKMSIVIALAELVYLAWVLRRINWKMDARLALAGACAIIPLITLNQQILTGKIIIAQQWELNCNYICLVLAFGLLSTFGRPAFAAQRTFRVFVASTVFVAMVAFVVAGHFYTYRAFLGVNLVSVAEARIYRNFSERHEAVSAVLLTHFWDEFLFRVRAPDAPPVLGGGAWLIQHPLPAVTTAEIPETYLARNEGVIAVGFEVLARREFTPEDLRKALREDLTRGECWPVANYFFSVRDCWDRFSNYRTNPLQRLSPWVDPIIKRYEDYLSALKTASAATPQVLIIRKTPIERARLLGLWAYKPLGEFHTDADGMRIALYAYMQTQAVNSNSSFGRMNTLQR
jgi:hypothetical protein